MPTQKLRLTKTEDQEYRTRLTQLEQTDIEIGRAADLSQEPDKFDLEQTQDEVASIYELPLGEVAVVVPAKMIVLKAIFITAVEMMTPWDHCPLELSDLKECSYYSDLMGMLYHFPPRLLNPWLKCEVPLNTRQVEGVIIAHGYSSIPSKYHDLSLVTVELLLKERHNGLSFEFVVQVDRSLMRKHQRQHRERLAFARSTKAGGLYSPKGRQFGDQQSVSPGKATKQPYARGADDESATQELQKPN